jgi:hypothetical protein
MMNETMMMTIIQFGRTVVVRRVWQRTNLDTLVGAKERAHRRSKGFEIHIVTLITTWRSLFKSKSSMPFLAHDDKM